jgi:hypothetical protein
MIAQSSSGLDCMFLAAPRASAEEAFPSPSTIPPASTVKHAQDFFHSGPAIPLTLHTLVRSWSSTANENAGGATKPGNRTAGPDPVHRLPRLRNWLTLYADGGDQP